MDPATRPTWMLPYAAIEFPVAVSSQPWRPASCPQRRRRAPAHGCSYKASGMFLSVREAGISKFSGETKTVAFWLVETVQATSSPSLNLPDGQYHNPLFQAGSTSG